MKLAKLSLAAITVVSLTASAFAADSLAGAFKEGKVSGVLKSFYLKTTKDGVANDSGAYAVGGALNYKTGSFNGLSAGFQFQTSHTLGVTVGDVVDSSVGIGVTMLSEAYLAYSVNDTTVKVGRQHIGTPLLSDSGSRLIRDYFMAATIVNTSLANTTLLGGVVTQHTGRNDVVSVPDAPIYTAYLATKVSGLSVRAQYDYSSSALASVSDKTQDYYLDAGYTISGDMPITFGAQYIGYKGTYSSNLFGAKVGAKVAGFGLGAYYTKTSNDGSVRGGWGNGSDPSYNSIQKLSGNGKGVTAYQGKISYDFSQVGVAGLSAFTRYATFNDYSGAGLDANEWDVDSTYKFAGALKGLKAQVRYATVSKDVPNSDFQDFRFIVNYNF